MADTVPQAAVVGNSTRRERRLERKLSRMFPNDEITLSVEVASTRLLNVRDPLIRTLRDTTWLFNPGRVYDYGKSIDEDGNQIPEEDRNDKEEELPFDVYGLDATTFDFFSVAYQFMRLGKVKLTLVRPGRLGKYDLIMVDCKSGLPVGVYEFAGMSDVGKFKRALVDRLGVNKIEDVIVRRMADPMFRVTYVRGGCAESYFRELFCTRNPKAARLMLEQEVNRKRDLMIKRRMERIERIREFVRRHPWIPFIFRHYRVLAVIFYNLVVL